MKTFLLLLCLALGLAAAPIQTSVTLVAASDLNDGTNYIGPYTLGMFNFNLLVFCYDLSDPSYAGASWAAYIYGFEDLSTAYFSNQADYITKYKQAAWLQSQAVLPQVDPDRIGIQYAAWGLFAANAPVTAESAIWLQASADQALAGFVGVDFTQFEVIESPPGTTPRIQGFIAQRFDSGITGSTTPPEIPEPASTVLIGAGLALWGLLRRKLPVC